MPAIETAWKEKEPRMNKQFANRKLAAAALLAIGFVTSSQGVNVLIDHGASWAGGAAGNQATIDFFNNNFLDTTVASGDYSDTANASVQVSIAAADVLVLTRTTYSGGYDSTDQAFYDSLTIPVIDLTSYTARSSKLGWEGGDVSIPAIDGNEATVTAAGAAVFGSAGSFDWYSGSGSFDAAGTGAVGDGAVLATIGGNHLVVGWHAGDTIASGAVQSGNRLLFNISGNGNNLPDTPDGQQALMDAVSAYTPLVQGVSTNPTGTATLTVIEAESGTLGGEFGVNTLAGATNITISPTGGGYSPGSDARVASYSITFPEADTYQLYARVYVGSDGYNDDSFFTAKTFGIKSSTTDTDWDMINGLAGGGFTAGQDIVTSSGGGGGTLVWKWFKWDTLFTVSEGGLTQTFQIGGREDGLYIDKLVFGPSDTALTVGNLDSGTLPVPVYSTNTFDGPFGIAIHRFNETYQNANLDGANPVGLAVFGDILCGTTFSGGSQGDGTVYTLSLDGTNFNSVVSLSSAVNAGKPQAGPTVSGSSFYGTTAVGGANKVGAVFVGQTNGTFNILHSFNALSSDTSQNVGGANPCATLAMSGSTLYGAASGGGANGKGTLFSLSTSGTGFTVLHDFSALDSGSGTNSDGVVPCGGLVLSGGTLYGTASGGGANGAGVVFSIGTGGAGFTVLHDFTAVDALTTTNSDGAYPIGALVLSNNVLYGSTLAGGAGGKGTLFAIGTDGSGFNVLHDFPATDPLTGANDGGASPSGGLMLSGNVLYGTASAGGAGAAGTVFSLDVTGPEFKTIYDFEPVATTGTNTYGAYPVSPVIRLGSELYGSAFGGGPGGAGTVYRLPIPMYAAIAGISAGNVMVDFVGAPNSTNVVQATADLSADPIVWQNVSTNVADGSGWWQYSGGIVLSNRFYRANSL